MSIESKEQEQTFHYPEWDQKLAYVSDFCRQVADQYLHYMENLSQGDDVPPYEMMYLAGEMSGIYLEQASAYIEQLEREVARLAADVTEPTDQPEDQINDE